MLPINGQTAGPIGLKFFLDTQWWPGSVKGYKNSKFKQKSFQGKRWALQLVDNKSLTLS